VNPCINQGRQSRDVVHSLSEAEIMVHEHQPSHLRRRISAEVLFSRDGYSLSFLDVVNVFDMVVVVLITISAVASGESLVLVSHEYLYDSQKENCILSRRKLY